MTGINHVTTGAVIAVGLNKPVLALPLALVSHFVTDALPHFNHDLRFGGHEIPHKITAQIDICTAVVISVVYGFILPSSAWLIWACCILAALPDAMWVHSDLLAGRPSPVRRGTFLGEMRYWHSKIQWSESFRGLYVEIGWLVIMFAILTRLVNS